MEITGTTIIKRKTKKKDDKKKLREEQRDIKHQQKINIQRQVDIYDKLSDKKLLEEAISITENHTMDESEKDIKIEAIKHIQEKRLYSRGTEYYSRDRHFTYYPNYTDPNFNSKIFHKTEFNNYRSQERPFDIEKGISDRCNPDNFQLTNIQKILKNFISPNTPYNGLLLFHGTGVGKTCTSITIAEQFKKYLKKLNKKIIVLLSPSIKDNFKKQIFDINKLKKQKKIVKGEHINQCTSNTYLNDIDLEDFSDHDIVRKKINRLINSYYQFMGYQEFANLIEKIEEDSIKGYAKKYHDNQKKNALKKYFSDRVIIIDEAHRIRISDDTQKKIAPPVIARIIKDADNIKLILLTATPMYNSPREIVWLVNLLLHNDNRPEINESDIFKSDGQFTTNGLEILKKKATGYISYLRGENPFSFPFRLYPQKRYDDKVLIHDQMPSKQMDGKDIEQIDKIKHLTLVGSKLSPYQLKRYMQLVPILRKDTIEETSEGGYAEIEKGLQSLNITYPTLKDTDNFYGSYGFDNCFSSNEDKNKFKYKPEILDKFGAFLDLDSIGEYSSKYKSIIEYIMNSEGIVYIYSQFIQGGILPLALALEQNGYERYGSKSNQLLDQSSKKIIKNEPISYEGKRKSEYTKDSDFIQGKYIIICGRTSISKNNDFEIQKSTEYENKDGKNIKIILGSPVAGEGLDLKFLREVHVLDPWHHLNKTEQVIGRAVRNCSHIQLPLEKRNVTVYSHVCTYPETHTDNDREILDTRIYRKAEKKAIFTGIVERELKKISIDCNLNKNDNVYLPEKIDKQIKITTSQKKTLDYHIGDKPFSNICNYMSQCDYSCEPNISQKIKPVDIDNDTYNLVFSENEINNVTTIIKSLFKSDFIYDLQDILSIMEKYPNIKTVFIYKSLHNLVDNKKNIVLDKYNRPGYIIYRGGYYIFQPFEQPDTNTIYIDRKKPFTKKKKNLNLEKLLHISAKTKEVSNTEKIITTDKLIPETILDPFLSSIEKISQNINYNKCSFWSTKKHTLHEIYTYHLLDRINIKDKINMLISVIELTKKKAYDKKYENILNYFKPYFLHVNTDLYYGDPTHKSDKSIFGFRTIEGNTNTYYCINTDKKYEKCTSIKIQKIEESNKKKVISPVKTGNIYGFMQYLNTQYIFKSVDKTHRKSTGAICANSKKSSIATLLNTLYEEAQPKYNIKGNLLKIEGQPKMNISDMCTELELLLRYYDKEKKNGIKWFFNNIETDIYKIASQ
tara:strand:+ start:623 stop:4348 length:3726 start_codon:yes stop_codon:yes gene_type:complete